ncbi:MAG: TIM barrel protein [Spirochaetes bacterium]|nr:TIM barrel protein [Spirochaetota bacterium]
MMDRKRFALNRIIYPYISLPDFIRLASEIGLQKIEIRNDLPEKDVLDSYSPDEIMGILEERKVEIITINALQNFNVPEILTDNLNELKTLIKTANKIKCRAIVFCPSNNSPEIQKEQEINRAAIETLKGFSHVLEDNNIMGYIEPLGFSTSSLRSILTAQKLIRESGSTNYRIVHDTFHFYLGPDTMNDLLTMYDRSLIGLLHVSAVDEQIPKENLTDNHRILPGTNGTRDILETKEQVKALIDTGCAEDISFEPFSDRVQKMNAEDLKTHVKRSMDYLLQ